MKSCRSERNSLLPPGSSVPLKKPEVSLPLNATGMGVLLRVPGRQELSRDFRWMEAPSVVLPAHHRVLGPQARSPHWPGSWGPSWWTLSQPWLWEG